MIEITDEKKNAIKELAQKYNLRLLLLFGSQTTGKVRKESDYDIAYLSGKPFDLMEEARLAENLGLIFKSKSIDLVNLKRTPSLLMKRIFDRHEILFCLNQREYFARQMYALRKYQEAKPLFALRDAANARFLNKHAG
ncbi:MAG: hypothetical protein A2734_02860 [Parcubacteria group bacterium RIFCSPHIGHO2_01_FULL_40_30]|nr:MAG: hypothetical protein A2734_02860 [Parcubacteria group bacterium RIFCSPHIGHO2_01_FULL_40_30]OHB23589.1 MAG: hypothetical protein A3I22_03000 [Parcubacteria group bacterium RIFCSPLOWO2_02_FULL_40_12]